MDEIGTTADNARYSRIAMLLHWAIAIGVIANWRIAASAEHLDKLERQALMGWHFAIGMTILLLTVARIVWRVVHRPPPLSAHLAPWERILAHSVHGIFYVLLIALPLLGWIGMSGYKYAIDMFGIVLPVLPVGFGEKTAHEILHLHGSLGFAMMLLVGLHLLGVIKHMVMDRDGNLWRMLPFGTPKN